MKTILIALLLLLGSVRPSPAILNKMDPTLNGGNILVGALTFSAVLRLYALNVYSGAQAITLLTTSCQQNQSGCTLSGPAGTPGTDLHTLAAMKTLLDAQVGEEAKFRWTTKLLDLIFLMQDQLITQATLRTQMGL